MPDDEVIKRLAAFFYYDGGIYFSYVEGSSIEDFDPALAEELIRRGLVGPPT